MNLHKFLLETGKRADLAKRVGVSPNYLWQVAVNYDGRQASVKLARRINEETLGVVTLESLRPDVWGSQKKDG